MWEIRQLVGQGNNHDVVTSCAGPWCGWWYPRGLRWQAFRWLALGVWVQPRAWAIDDDEEVVVVAMGNEPVGLWCGWW